MLSPRHAAILLIVLGAVSACASHPSYRATRSHPSSRQYTPPGPPDDPWGPHIREASTRFQVPEQWVREVMRQESGGRQYLGGDLTTSSAGAMGLMQVMPETYEGLRQRHGLGDDPYDPRDNILAGTAYIREMYDRYGAPGFLAAYNAGPRRLDDYLAGGTELPNETVNYLASVAPRLGGGTSMTGPLSVYADGGSAGGYAAPTQVAAAPRTAPVQVAMEPIFSPGDYAAPVQATAPLPAPQRFAAAAQPPVGEAQMAMEPIVSPGDYGTPTESAPSVYASSAPEPAPGPAPAVRRSEPAFRLVAVSPPGRFRASEPAAGWAIQVGAFASPAQARAAAEKARALARFLPRTAEAAVGSTGTPGGTVLFRARLKGMSGPAADDACRQLRAYGTECMVVPPDGHS
jgi:D-alanyl-D-alanine carboxypeptidase